MDLLINRCPIWEKILMRLVYNVNYIIDYDYINDMVTLFLIKHKSKTLFP